MDWWKKPRRVNVVVDNDSWVVPFAHELVARINSNGDHAMFYGDYNLGEAEVSFYLGCVKITPPEVLAKSRKNLVVHASELPKGRGFSPLTYLILEGASRIPVCLLEMAGEVDAGAIVRKEYIEFEGHELVDELRAVLGAAQVDICFNYLAADALPEAVPQVGEPSYYARRKPKDSELDLGKTLGGQFNLFRVADNEKYPVYFEKDGHTYILKIEKKK